MSALGTVDFLYDHLALIGDWGKTQFLFFVAFMLAVDQLHMTFVSENFWNFSQDLRTGRLDQVLVQPVNALFPSFFRYVRAASMLNVPVPWVALIYLGRQVGLPALSWWLLPFFVALALVLQVSLEILISMIMFVTVESWGINFLRVQLQSVSRWPSFVYRLPARMFFSTVVPVLLIGSPPVRVLFDPRDPRPLGWVVLATLGIWVVTGWAWRRGLARYESASS
jgi:ABC-2 type transport system permease protein